jgi:hypothetical protein
MHSGLVVRENVSGDTGKAPAIDAPRKLPTMRQLLIDQSIKFNLTDLGRVGTSTGGQWREGKHPCYGYAAQKQNPDAYPIVMRHALDLLLSG